MKKEISRANKPLLISPYPKYKDSGVEWLGEIPAHWELKRLKYLAPISDERYFEHNRDQIYIGLEHIESGTGKLLANPITEQVESIASTFKPGDVLFGKLRPYLAKALLPEFEGICSTELIVLRSHGIIHPKILFYQLLCEDLIRWISSMTFGTKMPRADPAQISNIYIAFGSNADQHSIIDFLDRATAKIDALVEKKEKLIELLKEKRAALITKAVTKGLDPTVPMKDSGVEWLRNIPTHWNVKPLNQYLLRITYGFTNPMPIVEEGPYMLTAFDIGDGKVFYENARCTTDEAFKHCITDKSRPQTGDILLTKDGTLGRVAIADGRQACINQSVALLRFNQKLVDIDFLYNLLRSPEYQARIVFEAGGTTIKHIYISRLAKMPVALPPRNEQCSISEFLKREILKIDYLIVKIQKGIELLREFRSALISASITGKIDVRSEGDFSEKLT
jgi:type I restriction enzyme S subunit